MNLAWLKQQPKFLYTMAVLFGIGVLFFGAMHIPKGVPEEKVEVTQNLSSESVPEPAQTVPKKTMHTVKDGETLSTIAEQYGIDVDTLEGANPDLNVDIHPGDQLVILPQKGALHTAGTGDTLWWIANAYHVEVAAILQANGKENEDLSIGESLFIPGGKKPKETERLLARAETTVSRSSGKRFSWPTEGELTSGFGHRWGRNHDGIDLANDIGTPVRAARSGRVSYSGWSSGYGRVVMIEHEQGYTTVYGHLNESYVSGGQYVKVGQSIAAMGNTGYSTGPHLHFEVRKNGTPINPYNVLP
ncbi:peptidoglycan DD-metalloendopeptidase family protein [Pelosinus fermentans]|uniref:Peptidase M23 n=1 Tax=Pelosinus fermentans JBW45 TaxID=1192197 RepID=I9NVN3_9FIRM|nr:M23 family metallopeptidase [Pelosinus fermentans]AJQ29429.1 Peptidase M23 [Pelosinus fermentans JBW45]